MKVAPISTLTGLRLLVVEDEFAIAEYIAILLEDLGCDVVGPVATVPEALVAVSEGTVDGVLLDANLDGRSSAPIALALHEAKIPFVVVTGYGARGLDEALDSAARLTKPFSTADLEAILVAVFGQG